MPDGNQERYITGAFGIYRGNDENKQKLKLNRDNRPSLTPAEKDAMRARASPTRPSGFKAVRAAEAAPRGCPGRSRLARLRAERRIRLPKKESVGAYCGA